MSWWPSVSRRNLQPELMDQADLDSHSHAQALQGLRRINWASRSDAILWPPIRRLANQLQPRPLRILDVASGGGDVSIRLWQRARRQGVALEIVGCDVSPLAIEMAKKRAGAVAADVHFE